MSLRLIVKRLIVLTGFGLTGCYAPEGQPFDPRTLQHGERETASALESPPMQPLPTKLENPNDGVPHSALTTRPAGESEATIRLSLQDLIQRAVANSLDVKIAGYGAAIDQTRVVEAEARFDPTFFLNAQFQHADTPSGGSVNPLDFFGSPIFATQSDTYTGQTGIRQNLEAGGQVELRYQAGKTDTTPAQTIINPYYQNDLTLQITQPLLQNFGNEVNRARITINRNTQKISLLDFRKALEENLANIEQTYWQLVQANREVRILQDLVDRTTKTYDILNERKKGGLDVTRLQTSQAQSSLESRQASLVQARSRVRDLSDQLKRLVNDPTLPVSGLVVIEPSASPMEVPVHFDLKEQINAGMENRLELAQQQLKVDNATTTLLVAKNNLLPSLNLVGSVSTQGVDSNYGNSIDTASRFENITYAVGFQFEVPIGNRAARAIYHRSLLQRQQAIDQYRVLIEQVAVEVKTSAREVATDWDLIVMARRARFAASDALLAIQQREENQEPLTPTFVQLKLDQQERLANAESSEASAIANYNIAISKLERAKGTLLRYNNVLMQEEKFPFGMMIKK